MACLKFYRYKNVDLERERSGRERSGREMTPFLNTVSKLI